MKKMEDQKYPIEWGVCVRVLVDDVPSTMQVYENAISNELFALCLERPDSRILAEHNIETWVMVK